MICSHTRGRIRLRLPALKGAPLPQLPKEGLKGVKSLSMNPKTGGALLEYDPDVLSAETIASFLEDLDPGAAEALRHPHLLEPRSLFGGPPPRLEDCPPPPSGEARSPDALPVPGAPGRKPRPRGSAEATSELINLGMAFLGTILSGFFSPRRLHVQLGALTALMMAGHAFKHRKRLRPLHQMTIVDLLGLPKSLRLPWSKPVEIDEEERELCEAAAAQEAPPAPSPPAEGGNGEAEAIGEAPSQGEAREESRPH
jgi:hypothetical protein